MKATKRANGLKLSVDGEEPLVKRILDLARCGLPPRPSLVRPNGFKAVLLTYSNRRRDVWVLVDSYSVG